MKEQTFKPIRKFKAILLVIMILIISCGNNPVTTREKSYEMLLEVGNEWIYSVEGFRVVNGDTLSAYGSLTKTITALVSHSEGFDLYHIEELFSITIEDSTISTTKSYFLANQSDELRLYEDTLTIDYFIPIKYNAQKHDSWIPGQNTSEKIEVMGLYNMIDVPFDVFHSCLCTKMTNSALPELMYRYYWGAHTEGVICYVEQNTDYYYIFKLTEATIY